MTGGSKHCLIYRELKGVSKGLLKFCFKTLSESRQMGGHRH